MFAYCLNDPTNKIDPFGNIGILTATFCGVAVWKIAVAVIGIIVAGCLVNVAAKNISTAPSFSYPKSNVKSQIKSKAKEYVETRKKNRDNEPRTHHIVAKAAWRAAPAREILQNVGLNPTTAPENLIVISHGLHKSMHTKNYYNYVNDKLMQCGDDRAAVEEALLEIRADIEYAEATGIKVWEVS